MTQASVGGVGRNGRCSTLPSQNETAVFCAISCQASATLPIGSETISRIGCGDGSSQTPVEPIQVLGVLRVIQSRRVGIGRVADGVQVLPVAHAQRHPQRLGDALSGRHFLDEARPFAPRRRSDPLRGPASAPGRTSTPSRSSPACAERTAARPETTDHGGIFRSLRSRRYGRTASDCNGTDGNSFPERWPSKSPARGRETAGDVMCAANSCRLKSFQAGRMLRIQPRLVAVAVPTDAEAVAVGGRFFGLRTQALVDERVLGPKQNVLQPDRRSLIGQPAAHGFSRRFAASPRQFDQALRLLRVSVLQHSAHSVPRDGHDQRIGHPHRPGGIDDVVFRLVHHQEHDRIIGGQDRQEAHEEAGQHLPPRLQESRTVPPRA